MGLGLETCDPDGLSRARGSPALTPGQTHSSPTAPGLLSGSGAAPGRECDQALQAILVTLEGPGLADFRVSLHSDHNGVSVKPRAPPACLCSCQC